ncbi:hypothetical protein BBJ28_00010242 [Nothophytophthora sp. Chile5]|nr:hypothetical protein BBJ28_00010242 [Nothophytophthora sp. Chile5]
MAWLKTELVSALGFAEVDEIVAYITSTFRSKEEVSSYLIELLGIPAARAESISTRLFSPAPPATSLARPGATAGKEGLVPRPSATNSRLKPSKAGKKHAGKTPTLLNNALVINCLRCGKIEYNGARRCAFCETELRYEADVVVDRAAQEHMEKLVLLDETGAERTRVIDTEQVLYDEEDERREGRRPISLALDLENKRFVEAADRKIPRNEHLAKDAREVYDGIQRKMGKEKRRGNRSGEPGVASTGGVSEAVVVVDDSYNLLFGATSAIMSSTISAKGPSVPLRRVASSSNRATAPDSPASRLWDFYACGLVDENDDGNESEDTEDELETQDWIQFQRQRAQARLADACQRESHAMRATKN